MTREEALGLINGFQAGKIDADNHDFYHALDYVVELLESQSQEPQGLDEAASNKKMAANLSSELHNLKVRGLIKENTYEKYKDWLKTIR